MRQQHYRFAHQILAGAVLRDSGVWWASAPVHGMAMVRETWAAAGEGLGPADLADGGSLQITPMSPQPGVDALVITLPPPEAPAECYFVALVKLQGRPPRYFVAEKGFDAPDGAPRAFWAEWRSGPGGAVMRIRGQDVPQISREAFVAMAAAECASMPAASFPLPGGAPFASPPGAAAGPAKKSRLGLFVGGGCLSLVALVVSFGGWLLYQEEGRGLYIPTSEVESVPVEPGKPFAVKFRWEGVGYAFNNVWLVVEEGKKNGGEFKLGGTFGCSRTSAPRKLEASPWRTPVHREEDKGGGAFAGWILVGDEYARSSSTPIECSGTIAPVTGSWTRARIVVTQRQRPSDFFAR